MRSTLFLDGSLGVIFIVFSLFRTEVDEKKQFVSEFFSDIPEKEILEINNSWKHHKLRVMRSLVAVAYEELDEDDKQIVTFSKENIS